MFPWLDSYDMSLAGLLQDWCCRPFSACTWAFMLICLVIDDVHFDYFIKGIGQASPIQINSNFFLVISRHFVERYFGSWWWTGRPGVLQFMGSQRVRHYWVTELTDWLWKDVNIPFWIQFVLCVYLCLHRGYIPLTHLMFLRWLFRKKPDKEKKKQKFFN